MTAASSSDVSSARSKPCCADHLVDESSASRLVRRFAPPQRTTQASESDDENSTNHVACTSVCHAANNFLCPWIDASIPKPAMRVTIEVPPALTSGNGTPTIGKQSRHHARVDEHVDEERQAQRAGEQPAERVLRFGRDVQAAADEREIQHEQQAQAEQAELLRHDREDEVRRALRQELEVRLRAVQPALAEQAARADRDLRLNDVVARAERIGLGIQEREHARLLIVAHERPEHGQRREPERAEHEHDAHADAGEQNRERARRP